MKNILLATAPYHRGVVESSGTWLPLGLVYLAGEIRNAGFDVEIYDALNKFYTHDQINKYLENINPDVVIVADAQPPVSTCSINDALKILQNAKSLNSKVITILEGVHSTFCYKEILEQNDFVDFIIRGESEVTICELLNKLKNNNNPTKVKGIAFKKDSKVITTSNRELITNLDILSPAWDLVNWKDYVFYGYPDKGFALVRFSRGCSYPCRFCSQQLYYQRTWRVRKPENFVDEIVHLHSKYKIELFLLRDEIPTVDRGLWEKVLDLLIEKNLDIQIFMETRADEIIRDKDILWKYKKAGVCHIYVGIESSFQEILDKFKKDIRVEQSKEAIDLINSHGIISEASFIMGHPDETRDSIRKTLEVAKDINPDLAFFLTLIPWPYSSLYKEMKQHVEVNDYSYFNFVDPIIKPKAMDREQLNTELINCFREFYMTRLKDLSKMDDFKQDYLFRMMYLVMNNSYMTGYIKYPGNISQLAHNHYQLNQFLQKSEIKKWLMQLDSVIPFKRLKQWLKDNKKEK